MKNSIIILLLLAVYFFNPLPAFSQLKMYSFEQIDSLQKIEKRHVVIFVHTDWCRYCHTMENTTFKNDEVVNILNKQFYFTSLDAEEKHSISFNGQIFKYKSTGTNTGIHQLAEQLATIDGKVSYPTIGILNASYEMVFQYNQFISSADFLKVLSETLKTSDS